MHPGIKLTEKVNDFGMRTRLSKMIECEKKKLPYSWTGRIKMTILLKRFTDLMQSQLKSTCHSHRRRIKKSKFHMDVQIPKAILSKKRIMLEGLNSLI